MSRKCNRKLAMRRRLQGPTDHITRAAAVFGKLSRMSVLASTHPLSEDLRRNLGLAMHGAFDALRRGVCSEGEAAALVYACDIAIVCAEADLGRQYLTTLRTAQEALLAVLVRQETHPQRRWICTGPEMSAIEAMLPIHDAQLESDDCTEGFITRCVDEVTRRIQIGHIKQVEAAPA